MEPIYLDYTCKLARHYFPDPGRAAGQKLFRAAGRLQMTHSAAIFVGAPPNRKLTTEPGA